MTGGGEYFDNAAATKPVDFPLPGGYANPSALHGAGIEAENAVKHYTNVILQTLGVDGAFKVIHTSSATESNNLAILGAVKKGWHIITSNIEHPSVAEVFKYLKNAGYCNVTYVAADADGRVDPAAIAEAVTLKTGLVSLFYVNSETGAINDIAALARAAKAASRAAGGGRLLFHTDAAQAAGKIRLELAGADMASLSAHKIHGPKGVGALLVKPSVNLKPIMYGGGQQGGIRPGTLNLQGIAQFSLALNDAYERFNENTAHIYALKQFLTDALTPLGSVVNYTVNPKTASPYILNITFSGVKGEVLVNALSAEGFFINTGSACHSARGGKSAVAKITPTRAEGSVRISFSRFNTMPECEQLAAAIERNLAVLRGIKVR